MAAGKYRVGRACRATRERLRQHLPDAFAGNALTRADTISAPGAACLAVSEGSSDTSFRIARRDRLPAPANACETSLSACRDAADARLAISADPAPASGVDPTVPSPPPAARAPSRARHIDSPCRSAPGARRNPAPPVQCPRPIWRTRQWSCRAAVKRAMVLSGSVTHWSPPYVAGKDPGAVARVEENPPAPIPMSAANPQSWRR